MKLLDPRNAAPIVFSKACADLGFSEKQTRRLLGAVIGQGVHEIDSWLKSGIISKRLGQHFAPLPRLSLEQVVTSPIDKFQKLLFRSSDGLLLESVAIPLLKPGKVSICLSSQIGCVMGCSFCATARMPKRRNLETWEIIDQFIQTRMFVEQGGRSVTGAVFMGMGEPFLNYDRVLAAAELLCFPVVNAIQSKAITISTVGLVQEIDRYTVEERPFRLSISIGAANDEKRAKLVPVAARTPVAQVIAAARRHALSRNKRVMISYVCVGGENVSVEDAKELADLIGDIPVRLDLIEVNDSTGVFRRPSTAEMSIFRDALTCYLKQPVVRRYSGGADIAAACGTLAGQAAPLSLAPLP